MRLLRLFGAGALVLLAGFVVNHTVLLSEDPDLAVQPPVAAGSGLTVPLVTRLGQEFDTLAEDVREVVTVPETVGLPAATAPTPALASAVQETLAPASAPNPDDGIVRASRAIEVAETPATSGQAPGAALLAEAPAAPPAPPPITASAAVVVDEASMGVLYGKAEHERRAPASLTKVATAAIAVQVGDLQGQVLNRIDADDMPDSSLMGLQPGDTYTLEDLLYGLMLRSGNDAARSIAEHLGGSEQVFVYWMNELVRRLGLQDTHFIDPHGLGGPDHYSSAYDLAVLARYGMQLETFARLAAAPTWQTHGTRSFTMHNLNPFMRVYPGADGLKTGFTEEAGPTFIGSAMRDGHRLYVVLLNSQDRFGEAAALLDWAFASYRWNAGG